MTTVSVRPAGLLRFITAGSVDDGKSTLIGRLLHDSESLLADQVSAIEAASRRRGLAAADLSLVTDGLIAEREQGITIDVAYRYFATARRKFIIGDAPGHVQYTRNMVTAASTADLAVLLVDGTKGLQPQTRRHAMIAHWLGVPRVVLAVNKLDRLADARPAFEAAVAAFRVATAAMPFAEVIAIPMSALEGDMVVERSERLDWYAGPTLLEVLESAPGRHDDALRTPGARERLRLPVQRVVRAVGAQLRPDAAVDGAKFRGYQGTMAGGTLAPGDEVVALPSGERARVVGVWRLESAVDAVQADDAVTVVLDREIDVSRGDVFASPASPPGVARTLLADVCWFDAEPLVTARPYLVKLGTRTVKALVSAPSTRIDVDTLRPVAAEGTLEMNDLGRVALQLQQPLVAEPWRDGTGTVSTVTGAFIVIDPVSNRTVAAGTVVGLDGAAPADAARVA